MSKSVTCKKHKSLRRFFFLILSACLALGVGLSVSQSASAAPVSASQSASTPSLANLAAGNCTGPLCGKVGNDSTSKSNILVVNGWPNTCAKCVKKALKPGQRSTIYFKDTDGFYIPTGWKAHDRSYGTFGAGWHKITDAQVLGLHVYRP